MRFRAFLVLLGLAAGPAGALGTAAGCGDTVRVDQDDDDGDGGAAGFGGDGPGLAGPGTGAGKLDGGKDALPDYVDPGCPDASAPIYDFQCDPYNQNNGDCLPTEGCYIYVQYPSEACEPEVYGAICAPAGSGTQGEPCGGGDCSPGFVCVVSGSGTQCVQLCQLSGEDGCPTGLVCEAIDVEGFGGCL
jgi:hypothetical protein